MKLVILLFCILPIGLFAQSKCRDITIFIADVQKRDSLVYLWKKDSCEYYYAYIVDSNGRCLAYKRTAKDKWLVLDAAKMSYM